MNYKPENKNKPQSAFTIVELLVVIVIVGILATIVITFYIGTHDKAIDSSLQADLKNASTQLELDKTTEGLYPSTKENANDGKGLKASSGAILDYSYSTSDNGYCLVASNNGRSYYINSNERTPKPGDCSNISFIRTLGGDDSKYGSSVVQTVDGGYVATGNTSSNNDDILIVKYSPLGNLLWSKTWGDENAEYGSSIIQASDGNYIITGDRYNYSSNNTDVFLNKFTPNGDLLWSKVWGNPAKNDSSGTVSQTNDGGYIITGSTITSDNKDLFIAKFTANGDLSWSKTWGGSDNDTGYTIKQTNDNGYIIAGDTYSYGAGESDVLLIKFSTDGTLSWFKTWGGSGYDRAYSVVQTSDNGYAITGETELKYSDTTGYSDKNILLAKFTSDGTLSWNKTIDGINHNDHGSQIIQLANNDIVITGTIDTANHCASKIKKNHKIAMNNATAVDGGSEIAFMNNSDCANNSGTDMFLSRFSDNGNLKWIKTQQRLSDEFGNSVTQTSEGGYVVVGNIGNYEDSDLLLVKYSSDGLIDGCAEPTCIDETNSVAVTNPSEPTPPEEPAPPAETTPPMTITFSSQELYINYPGENQTVCKEWAAPAGKQIKGFLVSQETESSYDFFIVSLDDTEVYNKSGSYTDDYIDTSSRTGITLKACMSADESIQDGYGGEVTGVIYN